MGIEPDVAIMQTQCKNTKLSHKPGIIIKTKDYLFVKIQLMHMITQVYQ